MAELDRCGHYSCTYCIPQSKTTAHWFKTTWWWVNHVFCLHLQSKISVRTQHPSKKTFIWETRNRHFIFVHAVILNLNKHGVYSGRDKYRRGREVSRNAFVPLHRGRMNTLSSLDNSCTKALWIWITYLISHVKSHVHYFPRVFPLNFCSGVERLRVWVTNAWWICKNRIRSRRAEPKCGRLHQQTNIPPEITHKRLNL